MRNTNLYTSKHLLRTRKESAYAEHARSIVLLIVIVKLSATTSHLSHSLLTSPCILRFQGRGTFIKRIATCTCIAIQSRNTGRQASNYRQVIMSECMSTLFSTLHLHPPAHLPLPLMHPKRAPTTPSPCPLAPSVSSAVRFPYAAQPLDTLPHPFQTKQQSSSHTTHSAPHPPSSY